MRLAVLSAGAARGIVSSMAAQHGFELEAQFGAVGAMQEALDAGAPCDLVVLTRRQIEALRTQGKVTASASVGTVRAGIAVRAGTPLPAIGAPQSLKEALLAAQEIRFPDPQKATAGIHFAKVLQALGVGEAPGRRFHRYENGAAAMHALAQGDSRAIGCTQITEILYTPGVALAGPLPAPFELATEYVAGLCRDCDPARRFLALLTGVSSKLQREKAGFEIDGVSS